MAKRKPWRRFKEKKQRNKQIRLICLAVLAVEAGILKEQGRLHFPVIEMTENREVVIYQLPLENEGGKASEVPQKDQVYGVRIRLKDGVVDFYRKEELHGDRY